MGFFDEVKSFFTGEEPQKAEKGMGKAAGKAAAPAMAANDIEVQRAKQDVQIAEQQLARAKERLAGAEQESINKQNGRYNTELATARQAWVAAKRRVDNYAYKIDYSAPHGSKKESQQNAKAAQLEAARDQAKAKYDAIQDKSQWWAQNPPDAHVNPIYKEDVASAEAALRRCQNRLNDAMNRVYKQAGAH